MLEIQFINSYFSIILPTLHCYTYDCLESLPRQLNVDSLTCQTNGAIIAFDYLKEELKLVGILIPIRWQRWWINLSQLGHPVHLRPLDYIYIDLVGFLSHAQMEF